jgi:protein-S-isoprenylcysteine O-methyltransferase Ste14
MSDPDVPGVRILPVVLFGLTIGASLVLHAIMPLRPIPPHLAATLQWIGIAAVVVALALIASAMLRFRAAGTNINPTRPVTALVVSGPFRFTRNPMYLGLAIVTIGITAMANSLWPVLMLIPTLMILQRAVIDPEERLLEAKFGDAYRSYKARVRRWI